MMPAEFEEKKERVQSNRQAPIAAGAVDETHRTNSGVMPRGGALAPKIYGRLLGSGRSFQACVSESALHPIFSER